MEFDEWFSGDNDEELFNEGRGDEYYLKNTYMKLRRRVQDTESKFPNPVTSRHAPSERPFVKDSDIIWHCGEIPSSSNDYQLIVDSLEHAEKLYAIHEDALKEVVRKPKRKWSPTYIEESERILRQCIDVVDECLRLMQAIEAKPTVPGPGSLLDAYNKLCKMASENSTENSRENSSPEDSGVLDDYFFYYLEDL